MALTRGAPRSAPSREQFPLQVFNRLHQPFEGNEHLLRLWKAGSETLGQISTLTDLLNMYTAPILHLHAATPGFDYRRMVAPLFYDLRVTDGPQPLAIALDSVDVLLLTVNYDTLVPLVMLTCWIAACMSSCRGKTCSLETVAWKTKRMQCTSAELGMNG